jgi:hypothetical protein
MTPVAAGRMTIEAAALRNDRASANHNNAETQRMRKPRRP